MNKLDYEDAYIEIKTEVQDDLGFYDEDMNDDSNEDAVNREADLRFLNKFGFDYSDVLDMPEPFGDKVLDENDWELEDEDFWETDNDEEDEW